MKVLQPQSWIEALEVKAANPEAVPIAGGTDLMVELNFARSRPEAILDLTGVEGLGDSEMVDGLVRVGAGVTYARLIAELRQQLPGLAIASRSVGSPQIRNRGTVGGNVATSSPAGDALPPLYACEAQVELASVSGTRLVAVSDFITGPKRNCLAGDELIAAFRIAPADGPQQFAKVGTRNAMVIAVCSFALSLTPSGTGVAACIGSAGPTPIRAHDAERFIEGVLEEERLWDSRRAIPEGALKRFGDFVELAARPIDDVRGTAGYRRHALRVLGARTLRWAWDEYRGEVSRCA